MRVWYGALVTRRLLLAALWLTTAITLPVELLAGLRSTGGYDWARRTISELGAATWNELGSPLHAWLNGAMVLAGLCLMVGAVWVARLPLPRRRLAAAGTLALVGLSTAATGLVPLDVDAAGHVLVSVPALALAPVPVLLLAPALLGACTTLLRAVRLLGWVSLVAGVVVALWLDAPVPGLLERVAVWPSTLLTAGGGAWLAMRDGALPQHV